MALRTAERGAGRGELAQVASLIGANMFIPATALITGPILARALGPEGRGLFAAVTTPLLLASVLGTLGLQDALTQFLARRGLSPASGLRHAAVALLPCTVVSTAAVAGVGVLLFDAPSTRHLFFILLSSLPINIAVSLLTGWATGVRAYQLVNRIKIVMASTRLLLVVGLALGDLITVPLACTVQLFGGAVALLAVAPAVRRHLREHDAVVDRPDTVDPRAGDLWRLAVTLFPGLLASLATSRLDQVVALPIMGARELGLYAAAVSLAELPLVFASAGRSLLMGGLRTGDSGLDHDLLVARGILLLTLVSGLGLAVCSPFLVPLLFGREFAGAVWPMVILCLGTSCLAAVNQATALCLRIDRPALQSVTLIGTTVLNMALLVVLGSAGATGAALASALAYLVGLLVLAALLRRAAPQGPGVADLLPRRETVTVLRNAVLRRSPAPGPRGASS
jgi:O-antigen/teichoic acid export membrane protein